MLVYIEFISRREGVSLEAFHFAAGRGPTGWSTKHQQDVLLMNLGRTFRLGPKPEYLAVWYTANEGLERLKGWEAIFASGEADDLEQTFRLGARIDRAGCYEALLDPVLAREGLYYAEYLDIADSADRQSLIDFFTERSRARPDCILNLLCNRIGRLAPDPPCIAIWTIPSWDHLDPIARDLDGKDRPVLLLDSAVYRDLGTEVI